MGSRCVDIDRDKLKAAIRRLPDEDMRYLLEDAIDHVPPATLLTIVRQYIDVRRLRPGGKQTRKATATLLGTVKAFEQASLAGDYFESFDVNSKNFMNRSRGTTSWIAECRRLLDRCVAESRAAEPGEVCQAFDIIFGLLDRLDTNLDDIIFFADEGGSWQVGVAWEKVMPVWFRVLSATADPGKYAERATGVLSRHLGYASAKMLTVARKAATPAQRRALREATTVRMNTTIS